nr:MAG TPA: hypothetical protein [Caudoviricetes sp.]
MRKSQTIYQLFTQTMYHLICKMSTLLCHFITIV